MLGLSCVLVAWFNSQGRSKLKQSLGTGIFHKWIAQDIPAAVSKQEGLTRVKTCQDAQDDAESVQGGMYLDRMR